MSLFEYIFLHTYSEKMPWGIPLETDSYLFCLWYDMIHYAPCKYVNNIEVLPSEMLIFRIKTYCPKGKTSWHLQKDVNKTNKQINNGNTSYLWGQPTIHMITFPRILSG